MDQWPTYTQMQARTHGHFRIYSRKKTEDDFNSTTIRIHRIVYNRVYILCELIWQIYRTPFIHLIRSSAYDEPTHGVRNSVSKSIGKKMASGMPNALYEVP